MCVNKAYRECLIPGLSHLINSFFFFTHFFLDPVTRPHLTWPPSQANVLPLDKCTSEAIGCQKEENMFLRLEFQRNHMKLVEISRFQEKLLIKIRIFGHRRRKGMP